jgi:EGF domain/EGF-like domain
VGWRASLSIGIVVWWGCASQHDASRIPQSSTDAAPPRAAYDAGADAMRSPDGDASPGSGRALEDAGDAPEAGPPRTARDAGVDAAEPNPCAGANCDPEEASCKAVQAAAVCSCATGYRDVHGNGELCEAIDECGLNFARCAANASCIDTPEGYACVCEPGFHGDGVKACEPNTVCVVERSEQQCGSDANCVAIGGDGHCWCATGFEGDGSTCTDRDECARGLDDCHPLAKCENRRGGYTCTCPQGHLGDGRGGSGCFLPRSRLSSPRIPAISGDCPAFVAGTSTLAQLLGVRLQVGAKSAQPTAALLFYWHASGSDATEADAMLPSVMRREILDAGGVIAAFEGSRDTGGDCSGTKLFSRGDFEVADLIAACAVRDHNVDPRRIYVTGCTSGGLQAGCMAVARSSYVAAVATNSGGIIQRMVMQAAHAPAAISMYGNSTGPLFVDFAVTSRTLSKQMSAFGGFALECNHGGGFCNAPAELKLAAWQFMKDHPFGLAESPYASGLPSGFPAYCSAQQ